MARDMAVEVERRLVLDGVLERGECPNPEDLSSVAESVYEKLHSQRELVNRLQVREMRLARPNAGTVIAAALLAERVISCVLTLNFDLSIAAALTQLGALEDVSVLAGPEDAARLGISNVIFLHRNAYADPDEWILRRQQLDTAWKNEWEHVVAARFLAAPKVVFAGMGSSAAVLSDTMTWVMKSLKNVRPAFVDPGVFQSSRLAQQLGLTEAEHIRVGWCDFMNRLARRVVQEQTARLATACHEFLATEGFEQENVSDILDQLISIGLLGVGKLRASWALEDRAYLPEVAIDTVLIADLVALVALIERVTEVSARFTDGGLVYFASRVGPTPVTFASGLGWRRWSSIEGMLRHRARSADRIAGRFRPRYAVVTGVHGARTTAAPPSDIVGERLTGDLVSGPDELEILDGDEIRRENTLAAKLVI